MSQLLMEDLVNRFEDRREIKNLMGKYVQSLVLRRDHDLWNDFWCKEMEDVTIALNDGYYTGSESIQKYYKSWEDKVLACSKILQNIFPEQLGELSDEELYGTGFFEQKPLQNAVIRVGGDRKTAKGLWCCNGSFTDITPGGPCAYWIWAYFAVDFIYEKEEWKIWHLQYLEDVKSPSGQNWAGEITEPPKRSEFAAVKELKIAEPDISLILREYYNAKRPFTPTPKVPEDYETFSETFSYGLERR